MTGAPFDHQVKVVRSFDGTGIAVRTTDPASPDPQLPLLLSNGIGTMLSFWEKSLIDLTRERAIVTWDHRGLYESGAPASDRIDPGAHAEDAIAVLDDAGIDRFVLVGWSSGGRIALEIACRYPERVASLAVICGGYGHPPGRVLTHFEFASLIPLAAGIGKHFAGPLRDALSALVGRPELPGILRQTGMLAPTADTAALAALIRDIASADLHALLANYEAVAGDAAPEILQEIEAPTLLVAGAIDQVVSRRMMEEMQRRIPGAELLVYERASHYLPIEYPARLSDDLRRFFSDAMVA